MANKPTVLPIWDTDETNTTEPDAPHKLDGWLAPGGVPEKPPFQTFNFWQNNVYKWAAWLEEICDGLLLQGRADFSYVSDTQLGVAGGGYVHHGTKSQVLTIDAIINHTITTPGTSQMMFFYLDDSAIVTKGDGIITASEIINSTTSPSYNTAKKAWYNTLDMCIFGMWIDGSGDLNEFEHSGDLVTYSQDFADLVSTAVDSTWIDVPLTIPDFATKAEVTGIAHYLSGSGGNARWKTTGATGSTGHALTTCNSQDQDAKNTVVVTTDSDNEISVSSSGTLAANEIAISTVGWFFPNGM